MTNNKNSHKNANTHHKALAKEPLEKLQSDLVSRFRKLHQEQVDIFEETLDSFEEDCTKEIKETLEKHLKKQMEENFKTLLKSCQSDITAVVAPLAQQAEKDMRSLNSEIFRTSSLCKDIESQYTLRWGHPLLSLILCTSLTITFVVIILVLLQTSPMSLFLMNSRNREAYQIGLDSLAWRASYKAKQALENIQKQQEPEINVKLQDGPSKNAKKKKTSLK